MSEMSKPDGDIDFGTADMHLELHRLHQRFGVAFAQIALQCGRNAASFSTNMRDVATSWPRRQAISRVVCAAMEARRRACNVDLQLPGKAPPGARARQRDETRRAVLDAAIALFARQGFEGTALPAIAAASGIAVPLIIYHFKSKDLLWRASVDEVFARVEAHLERYRAAIEAATGGAFYRLCARAHVTALAAHPEYMRILFQEGTQESERLTWLVHTHQAQMREFLIAIIMRAQSEGIVPAIDPAHAKFIFSGAFCLPIVLGPEYRLVTGEDSLSADFIERHIDICLHIMLPTVDWSAPKNR